MARRHSFKLWVASQIVFGYLLSPLAGWSQEVIPDGTTATGDPGSCAVACSITGGALSTTGSNLFHSFEQFSVPDGSVVTFDHASSVRNIFARVTGRELSIINGLIRNDITSDTNLFLINPNGIIFGANGGLDLGGSFIATTADAIQFENQGSFSTNINSDSSEATLLTVNPSAFLFDQTVPQPIINQANINPTIFSFGLTVQESKSLLLVGGDIILDQSPSGFLGGSITAPSGQVELGGVNSPAAVGLKVDDNRLSLSYRENTPLANVFINSNANINVSNSSSLDRAAGSLVINANSISFLNGGFVSSTTFGTEDAGSISLKANESISLSGTFIDSSTSGSGDGGSLNISTNKLTFENFAFIRVGTNGVGNAGDIYLNADSISLDNSFITTDAFSSPGSVGNVGEIDIQTNTLSLMNGSEISTETFGEAINTETSGLIRINAKGFVSLTGENSSITSETFGQRNASDIIINTPELIIRELASISAITFSEGNAGNVFINNANQVVLSNGSITTETNALGSGGNITLDADQLTANSGASITATATATADSTTQGGSVTLNTNQINISGKTTGILAETQGPASAGLITLGPNRNSENLTVNFQEGADISAATSSSGAGGQVTVVVPEAITFSGNGSLSTRSTGSGSAGNVSVQTDGRFRVQDGARIAVSGESTGDSGILEVAAATAILNDGQLLASTQDGEGGNIRLQIEDALVLRNESRISAEAFEEADGGNVSISSPFIIALFPDGLNGNDIEASADAGNGGRITIQTNTLFNLAEAVAEDGNMTNDLDASSGTGIDGEVIIETLQVDPTQGTTALPTDTADPEIARGCQAGSNGQFIASGQGGIPSNPYEPLSSAGIQEDIYPAGQTIGQQSNSNKVAESIDQELLEAQSWDRNSQGNVVLVAANQEYHGSCQHSLGGS